MLKSMWLVAVVGIAIVVSEPLSARCRQFGGGGRRACRWQRQAGPCQYQGGLSAQCAPTCMPATCATATCAPSCCAPTATCAVGCAATAGTSTAPDTTATTGTTGLSIGATNAPMPPVETTDAAKPQPPVSPEEQAMWDELVEKKVVEKGDYDSAWVKATSEDRKKLYDALIAIANGTAK